MRNLLLLPFLLILASPGQHAVRSDEDSAVVVLGFQWSRSRKTVEKSAEPAIVPPAPAMTVHDKNFERNRRINDPAGARDPNADTIDARSAAIEKNVQESRSSGRKTVNGFEYQVKVRNASTKIIEIVFWEYQFIESKDPANLLRRQFLCGVNIKPNKEKELEAFSLASPSVAVNVDSLANKSEKLFAEKVVINRVEYADGSIWQRKDWNFAEMKPVIARAIATPWGAEMCRSL
jgi:hypothetical protein